MHSYDGLRDSLTNLACPSLLYEELRRELSRSQRSLTSLTGIRIMLDSAGEQIGEQTNTGEAISSQPDLVGGFQTDRVILHLCQAMTDATRGEDICARMGEREFLIILSGAAVEAESVISRITTGWQKSRRRDVRSNQNSQFVLSYATTVSEINETSLDFLNRLDLQLLKVAL